VSLRLGLVLLRRRLRKRAADGADADSQRSRDGYDSDDRLR